MGSWVRFSTRHFKHNFQMPLRNVSLVRFSKKTLIRLNRLSKGLSTRLSMFICFVLLVQLDYHRTSTPLVGFDWLDRLLLSTPLVDIVRYSGNADIVRPRSDGNCPSLSTSKAFVKISATWRFVLMCRKRYLQPERALEWSDSALRYAKSTRRIWGYEPGRYCSCCRSIGESDPW